MNIVEGNAHVDRNAKSVARRDRPPLRGVELVRSEAAKVCDIAKWIAKATAVANHFPAPSTESCGVAKKTLEATKLQSRTRSAESGQPCDSGCLSSK